MKHYTGIEYLKIDIANNFGKDKLTFDDRIAWFDSNYPNLDWNQVESPCLAYAGLQAYAQALKGEPSGYPISLDATSSGSQFLALLTGDRKAAKMCNLIGDGQRHDLYTEVYNEVKTRVNLPKLARSDVKKAIMTSLYSSLATPKAIFGEDNIEAFNTVMNEMMPDCWELNSFFLDAWNPEATEYNWVMPDNFHVHCPVEYMQSEHVVFNDKEVQVNYKVQGTKKKGRFLGANVTHSKPY